MVEHAGAGGESASLNTAAYKIQVSTDGVNFTTVVNVTGNQDSITTNDITPTTARYVRLNIVTPTQSGGAPASIYEFQVFSPQASPGRRFHIIGVARFPNGDSRGNGQLRGHRGSALWIRWNGDDERQRLAVGSYRQLQSCGGERGRYQLCESCDGGVHSSRQSIR